MPFFSAKFMSILDFVCARKLNETLTSDIKLNDQLDLAEWARLFKTNDVVG